MGRASLYACIRRGKAWRGYSGPPYRNSRKRNLTEKKKTRLTLLPDEQMNTIHRLSYHTLSKNNTSARKACVQHEAIDD